MDVIVASKGDSTLAWYENDGTGRFSKRAITTEVLTPYTHTVEGADFDGDDDVDVMAVGRQDSKITWYEHDGGTWTERSVGPVGISRPTAARAVDLDQDGAVDVVSIHTDNGNENRLAWYRNQGDGTFSKQKVISLGIYKELRIADLDGQNGRDVVTTTEVDGTTQEQIVWFPNQGDDTFGSMIQIEQVLRFDKVEVADVDDDGNTDVLAHAEHTSYEGLDWYQNDGSPADGGWTTHLISDSLNSKVSALHAADINQNGDTDVLAGSYSYQVHLYENDGTPSSGEEWSVQTIAWGNGAEAVGAADFDGDSETDVFYAAKSDNRVAWVKNDGTGTFPLGSNQYTVTTPKNLNARSLHVADVDGDGNSEIIEAGAYILWYEESGVQSYTSNVISFETNGAKVVDLDDDGDPDVLGISQSGDARPGHNVVWHENDGQGHFSGSKLLTSTTRNIFSFTTEDMNGDGHLDIVYASQPSGGSNPDPGRVVLRTNDGDGTFTTQVLEDEGRFNDVETMDVNGDGNMDVLQQTRSGNTWTNPKIEWYENQGNGDFPPASSSPNEGTTVTPQPGLVMKGSDLDGDGDRDLLVSSVGKVPQAFVWHENEDGATTFRRDTVETPSPVPRDDFHNEEVTGFDTGDVNGDGKMDIVYSHARLTWRRNDGHENFSAHTLGYSVSGGTTLGDVDDDGDSDILVKEQRQVQSAADRLVWYENRNLDLPDPPSNPTVQTVAPQNVTRGVEEVKLTWSASPSSDVQKYFIYRERIPFGSARGFDPVRNPYYYEYALIDSVSAGQTSYVDRDPILQADSTYHYRIAAAAPFNLTSAFTAERTVTPKPPLTAHSLRPRSGAPGTPVRIKGSGLSPQASEHTVTVAGVQAPVDSAKKSVIYARVPSASALPDTARGPVTVTVKTEGRTRTVAEDFTLVRGGSASFVAAGSNVAPVVSSYTGTAWADYDEDGDADLVTVGEDRNGTPSTQLYRNDKGTLTLVDEGLADVQNAVEWGDYNGNGTLDLMLVGLDNTVTLYQNQGDGTLSKSLVSSGRNPDGSGIHNAGVHGRFHDYDTDGTLDLYVTRVDESDGQLYRNDEAEVFWIEEPYPAYSVPVAEFFEPDGHDVTSPSGRMTDWGDYNGDGLVDLLTTSGEVFRNEGDGTFTQADVASGPNTYLGVSQGTAAWVDFDEDGDLDAAMAGRDLNYEPATKIYENKGGGTFEAIGANLTGVRNNPALAWGDFDGDGDPDLAVAGQTQDVNGTTNYSTKIYRNDSGSFTAVGAGLTGLANASLSTIDVDTDGDLDLVATGRTRPNYDRARRLYLNESPAAAQTKTVSGDGTQDFGGTGTDLTFSGVSGSGDVTVERYDEGVRNANGISQSNVSEYVVSVDTSSGLTFSSARIELAVSEFLGIDDPSEVTIYKRPSGGGKFTQLETTVGTNGTANDVSDDTLYATTSSFSDFVLASNSQGLPVELAQFEAKIADRAVRLSWTTTSEQNNAGFRVQRRYGTAAWTTLGRVEGRGSTTQVQKYHFSDADLPYEADSLTYRLKQVDADGSASFSRTITVDREVDEVQLLGTYPNPTAQRAVVRYALPEEQHVTLRLYDVLGRRVRTVVNTTSKGRHKSILDVSDLPSGLYFLRLRAGDEMRTEKITVVK